MNIIAIDQGTTSTRSFILNEAGQGSVAYSKEHQQIYPQNGWVEHDPEELLKNIIDCIQAAIKSSKNTTIDAIGIDNQGESCLAWHRDTGEPISPVIVWQDRRTEAVVSALKADNAESLTMQKAGLPLDPYFSATKLAWIINNIPQAKQLLAKGKLCLGTTDAFFNQRLTGKCFTDISTASRTSLLNLETGQWDEDLCKLFGVPLEALPEIKPTMGNLGVIRIADQEIPLTASVVDQQASLYGHGCRKQGDTKITFGTGAFALSVTGSQLLKSSKSGLLPTIAWWEENKQPIYALDGGVYCASSAINWAKSLGLFKAYNEISQFSKAPAITRKLAFVPALTGLGCPYWDGSAAGLWIGMRLDTSAPDMLQAILEGIALRAVEVITAMSEQSAMSEKKAMSGQTPLKDEISIDGGMSANPYFCQFLADVMQKKIKVQEQAELTALGTALMAKEATAARGANAESHKVATPIQYQTYTPKNNYDGAIELFNEAVKRSQGWHQE